MTRESAADRALIVRKLRDGGQSMTMKLKNRLAFSTAASRRFSLLFLPVELRFDAGQLGRTGAEVEVLELRPQDAVHEITAVHHGLVDPLARFLGFAQPQGRHSLGIEIDKERPSALEGQAGGQIDGRGRLSDPALLVRYGQDLIHRQALFHVKHGPPEGPFSSGSRGEGPGSGRPPGSFPVSSELRRGSPASSVRASRPPLGSGPIRSGSPRPAGIFIESVLPALAISRSCFRM